MTSNDSTTQDSGLIGVLGPILVLGYVVVGILWADAHPEDRERLIGFDVVDFLSQVLLWPAHVVGLLPL